MKETTVKKFGTVFSIIFMIVLLLLAITFVPLAVIWSINTLFPIAAIPYGFMQWCAVVVLGIFTRGDASLNVK